MESLRNVVVRGWVNSNMHVADSDQNFSDVRRVNLAIVIFICTSLEEQLLFSYKPIIHVKRFSKLKSIIFCEHAAEHLVRQCMAAYLFLDF